MTNYPERARATGQSGRCRHCAEAVVLVEYMGQRSWFHSGTSFKACRYGDETEAEAV